MMPAPAERWLWLLRHAKAVTEPPRGGTDHDRPLAPRGRRDADALGRHLGDTGDHLGLLAGDLPELVLCSTAVRTVETADGVLGHLASRPQVLHVRALYGASPDDVLEQVSVVQDERRSIMVVGHNPTVEALVLELLAAATNGASVVDDRPGAMVSGAGAAAPRPEGDGRHPGRARGKALQRLERRGFPTCGLAVFRFSGTWQAVLREPPTVAGLFFPPY
jgi:phosphohistidine phosphatase